MKAKLLILPVIAMMGLMVSAPLPASADTTDPTRVEIEAIMIMTPKLRKDLHAAFLKRKRISPIKRTRKRQIAKAKHMLAWHDHTSYEWSQWWHSKARKPKRWKK